MDDEAVDTATAGESTKAEAPKAEATAPFIGGEAEAEAKPEAEAEAEAGAGSDIPPLPPKVIPEVEEKSPIADTEAVANAEEAEATISDENKMAAVLDAAEDEGITAAEMLDASIAKLRQEHIKLGGGSNTPHSKAITFASTARDLVASV